MDDIRVLQQQNYPYLISHKEKIYCSKIYNNTIFCNLGLYRIMSEIITYIC